jgi:hypothetical protein
MNVITFLTCMFRYEEEDEFEGAFNALIEKLNDKLWLKFIYASRKK